MRRILLVLMAVLLIVVIVLAVFLVQQVQKQQGNNGGNGTTTPTTPATFVATGMPYTRGTQIIDANGHPLLLHGAQIETSFNYIKRWNSGERPATAVPSSVFQTMVQSWH